MMVPALAGCVSTNPTQIGPIWVDRLLMDRPGGTTSATRRRSHVPTGAGSRAVPTVGCYLEE